MNAMHNDKHSKLKSILQLHGLAICVLQPNVIVTPWLYKCNIKEDKTTKNYQCLLKKSRGLNNNEIKAGRCGRRGELLLSCCQPGGEREREGVARGEPLYTLGSIGRLQNLELEQSLSYGST